MNSTAVTAGIRVEVRPEFQETHSEADSDYFVFSYTVRIVNTNPYPVKLISRKWHVFDSIFQHSEVEGAGVVGEQPELNEGEEFKYTSACNLFSDIGYMKGNYIFLNLNTGKTFTVDIPQFYLIPPHRKN